YWRQEQFVDFLIKNTNKAHPIYLISFFDLLPGMTRTAFTVQGSSWKRNSFSFYKYHLPLDEYLKKIRKKFWTHANKYFDMALPASEEAMFSYCKPEEDVKEVLEFDLPYFVAMVQRHFKPSLFAHCYHVQEMLRRYKRLGI